MIEKGSKSHEWRNCEESELDPVPGEKPFLWYYSFVWATFSNKISIAINEKVEYKTVHDWVDLEMNTQSVKKTRNYIVLFEKEEYCNVD